MPTCCWISRMSTESTVMEAYGDNPIAINSAPQSRSLPSISATPFRPEHFQTWCRCLNWVHKDRNISKYTGGTGRKWSSMVFKSHETCVCYIPCMLMLDWCCQKWQNNYVLENLKWIVFFSPWNTGHNLELVLKNRSFRQRWSALRPVWC